MFNLSSHRGRVQQCTFEHIVEDPVPIPSTQVETVSFQNITPQFVDIPEAMWRCMNEAWECNIRNSDELIVMALETCEHHIGDESALMQFYSLRRTCTSNWRGAQARRSGRPLHDWSADASCGLWRLGQPGAVGLEGPTQSHPQLRQPGECTDANLERSALARWTLWLSL